ncbi:uncharacterized protein E0L32_007750 [Thyridium curvatum]|uniref:Xylanolytic transcriptional activator regulatory domain-containing protein n=1 Tax=Thyridium curvatum TaxID=1093900 RepID=A0A507B2M4_9PEZI|nr:uncharacterized protein E0L32_007750 [Thyridium curvatum]TPX11539.1 hypothetical protein E0L32_007750 [Thyridium curvatum]
MQPQSFISRMKTYHQVDSARVKTPQSAVRQASLTSPPKYTFRFLPRPQIAASYTTGKPLSILMCWHSSRRAAGPDDPAAAYLRCIVSAFFRSVHPGFPVLDRSAFELRYHQGTASLFLLQTVFFLSATVCDDNIFEGSQIGNRAQARRAFYNRAKLLYDADYETDNTLLTACLFLLGFWWQRPQEQKDSWHWLGCAISLAQTMGMHRSTEQSCLSPRTRSLWKRIWWSLYIRDRHVSAALGRPYRIRDQDCNPEPLGEADFEFDSHTTTDIIAKQGAYHIAYTQNVSSLTILLGRILTLRFSPIEHCAPADIEDVGARLRDWEQNLPGVVLQRSMSGKLGASFWTAMLYASFHNCQILLYRPTREQGIEGGLNEVAIRAADSITRIAEDVLTANTLRKCQLHMIPALFAALSIHAVVIQREETVHRLLAENRSRQCMLALRELSKSWPVGGWILGLL